MPKKWNYHLNPPQKKSDLNKESMLDYVAKYKPEDLEWFLDVLENNREKKENNLTKKEIDGFNNPAIRKAFGKRYFPALYESKKKKTDKESFEERMRKLRESINK